MAYDLQAWLNLSLRWLHVVAVCPSGGMANVYTYLARANVALSVTLTASESAWASELASASRSSRTRYYC